MEQWREFGKGLRRYINPATFPVAGLAKTHERGIRYPLPNYLRVQPEVALKIPLADIF
jgi:hypothetical protein